jgi:hypothetical protein
MRTKLLVSLLLAAASSSVFAMPSDPVKHTGILEIALTGGGYKAGTEDSGYGIQVASISAGGKIIGDVVKVDPEYKFGGSILVGYFFPCSSINVDASYFGTHHSLDDITTGPVTASLMPPDFVLGNQVVGAAESNYNFKYDFANVEIGSLTRVNQNGLIINPQLGLSYARVQTDQSVGYAGESIPAGSSAFAEQKTKFNGFGPSVGFALDFVVCQPISLMGNFRYSGLIGKVDSSYAAIATGAVNEVSSITLTSRTSLVSVLQSELAVGYDFDWVSAFCGNIALGYQVTKFLNSGEQASFIDDVSDAQFVSGGTNSNVHGWFLRLTMDFPV